jgi:hypothetical protein
LAGATFRAAGRSCAEIGTRIVSQYA